MNYRIAVVGPAKTGKTTWIERLYTGNFIREYIPTLGIRTTDIVFYTEDGPVTFEVTECRKLQHGNIDGVIVFSTSETPSTTIENLILSSPRGTPIILVMNKVDCKSGSHDVLRNIAKRYNIPFTKISAKTNYNYEQPFLSFIDADTFIDAPAVAPPEPDFVIDKNKYELYRKQLKE